MKNIKNIIEQKYPPENPNDLWMKDDVLYKSTHKGWTPLTAGGGSSTNGVTSTTWQELKDKRDAGKLIPGSLYRITDYNCTTTQENTQSAGHQFDIVLLALSENKLAEEGWAMMHNNIYDVTFSDGVTKKCYFYVTLIQDGTSYGNVVDVETLLGIGSEGLFGVNASFVVNEEEKTATTDYYDSTALTAENLTYNYFQNSNLSAWKVWYCLDNDTDRFAWADDSVDEGNLASITINVVADRVYLRDVSNDTILADINAYAWTSTYIVMGHEEVETIYTNSETPQIGDKTWHPRNQSFTGHEITSYTPAHEGTGLPNGRGVIYRLIDEWNNDVGYDFKNIQFIRKITDGGLINPSTGTNTWVYTFSVCNGDTKEFSDYSITSKTFLDDVGDSSLCYENKIKSAIIAGGLSYVLNNVVFHALNIPNDTTRSMHHNTCEYTINVTIGYGDEGFEHIIFTKATNIDYNTSLSSPIISDSKRAVFESFAPI